MSKFSKAEMAEKIKLLMAPIIYPFLCVEDQIVAQDFKSYAYPELKKDLLTGAPTFNEIVAHYLKTGPKANKIKLEPLPPYILSPIGSTAKAGQQKSRSTSSDDSSEEECTKPATKDTSQKQPAKLAQKRKETSSEDSSEEEAPKKRPVTVQKKETSSSSDEDSSSEAEPPKKPNAASSQKKVVKTATKHMLKKMESSSEESSDEEETTAKVNQKPAAESISRKAESSSEDSSDETQTASKNAKQKTQKKEPAKQVRKQKEFRSEKATLLWGPSKDKKARSVKTGPAKKEEAAVIPWCFRPKQVQKRDQDGRSEESNTTAVKKPVTNPANKSKEKDRSQDGANEVETVYRKTDSSTEESSDESSSEEDSSSSEEDSSSSDEEFTDFREDFDVPIKNQNPLIENATPIEKRRSLAYAIIYDYLWEQSQDLAAFFHKRVKADGLVDGAPTFNQILTHYLETGPRAHKLKLRTDRPGKYSSSSSSEDEETLKLAEKTKMAVVTKTPEDIESGLSRLIDPFLDEDEDAMYRLIPPHLRHLVPQCFA